MKRWEALKERSHANIQSEKGILNRQIRSIQTEGHFGDIKENDDFVGSIIVQPIKYTKNSCCMQSAETSINIIDSFAIRYRNLRGKKGKM